MVTKILALDEELIPDAEAQPQYAFGDPRLHEAVLAAISAASTEEIAARVAHVREGATERNYAATIAAERRRDAQRHRSSFGPGGAFGTAAVPIESI